jgi:5-methylcytosine-specific restriction protein A
MKSGADQQYDAERRLEQETRRLYGTQRWKRLRQRQLADHPLCKKCLEKGIVEPATVCDHVTPHRGSVIQFWFGPFDSLCKPCHDGTKQQQERSGYSTDVGRDGMPIDPNHPWYQQGGY